MPSSLAQAYLETIYNITAEGDVVVNARLAEKFGVSRPGVTSMLRRLDRDGYLRSDQTNGLGLTELGSSEAEASLRRHRLAECFLFEILHLDWVTCHHEAQVLQHALTPAIEAGLVVLLSNPATCPHGNPIPGRGLPFADFLHVRAAFRLSNAFTDTLVRVLCISEVVEDERGLLESVEATGIRPGVDVLLRAATLAVPGFLILDLAGQRATLQQVVAEKIWVHRLE